MNAFIEFLYRYLGIPFGWVMTQMYTVFPNYVIVLIVFTLVTRCIMIPTNLQQKKSAARQQRLQPKIRKIQQKYAGNQQKIQQETQALYSREGAAGMNMGCMSMLITMPIFYGIAGAVYYPLKYPLGFHNAFPGVIETLEAAFTKLHELDAGFAELVGSSGAIAGKQVGIMEHIQALLMNPYSEVQELMSGVPAAAIEQIRDFSSNFEIFGISLGVKPEWTSLSIIVPVASLLFSVSLSLYTMLIQRKQNPGQQQNMMMMGCMTLGMPLFMFYFTMTLPVATGIYWATGSFLSLVQGIVFAHTLAPNKVLAQLMVEDTVNRCAREKEVKSGKIRRKSDDALS